MSYDIINMTKKAFQNLFNNRQTNITKSSSPLQVYSGYEVEDYEILRKFSIFNATLEAEYYLDGFGVKTLYECVPFVNPKSMNIDRLNFPIPDDGFHAETIEYVALTDALNRSNLDKSFCAVEIGAGWGPWMVAAGVIAKQKGCLDLKLIGVEASLERFNLMCRHLEMNNLRIQKGTEEDKQLGSVFTRLFNGAIWVNDGVIWFPESDVADMGSAASMSDDSTDYRGAILANRTVSCKRLDTLLQDLGVIVDFMHIDIQGSELDLLKDQIEWVSNNVKTLMIATHSRSIEGSLIELFFAQGWELHREKPCRVDWKKNCSLVGRTIVDGSQYWLNSRLVNIN